MDPDPDGDSILLQILILIVITLINAFFSCAEMAMVSSNKNKIKRLADGGNKKAELVQKIMEEPTKFLSTIQVAITLAGFFSAGSAATGLSGPLGEFLLKIHIPYGDEISFFLVTIILAFFTLVFGELVPKRIALSKTEEISMFVIAPVNLLSKVASPFIKLLSFSTNLVMKLFGSKINVQEDILSREEIKSLIDEALAKEIMTPKVNVFAINILDPIESYVDKLMDTKYSRIPVYEDDIDNVIGILYFKDYMKEAIKVGYSNVNMRSILIKPYLVPDSKNIYELFKELQVSKNHIAVLIDEYGGFSGIVTMEDLVEEVMGDIEDEYDIYVPKIKMLDNSTYLLDGLLTIDELNEELDLGISSENYDTISGFLIDTMGAIPSDDEDRTIEIDNLVFKIISVKQKRIDKIKLYIGTVS